LTFKLLFTDEAKNQLKDLDDKRLKAVRKTLGYLETNPRHPSLNTHKYSSITGPNGQEIFEAYAQNKTPGAYRIFWCYGPQKGEITIVNISPHP